MKTTFISTVTLWNSPRSSLDKLQDSLTKANTELTTGRHADVGLALGYKVGEALSLRQQRAEIETLTDSNGLVLQRLKTDEVAEEEAVPLKQPKAKRVTAGDNLNGCAERPPSRTSAAPPIPLVGSDRPPPAESRR